MINTSTLITFLKIGYWYFQLLEGWRMMTIFNIFYLIKFVKVVKVVKLFIFCRFSIDFIVDLTSSVNTKYNKIQIVLP
jgi:hypothetical protein